MANAQTAVLTRHLAGWQLMLAGGAIVVGTYYVFIALGPDWTGAQVATYVAANAVLVVSALVAARRHRAMAAMSLLLAAGAAASVAGDLIFYFLTLVQGDVAYPSAADAAYLSSYALVAAAFLVAVRRRSPGWDFTSAIDAGIVTVSAGYLLFEFVVVPTLAGSGQDLATVVSVLYPLGDLMIITVGARLVLGAGTRTTALRMIGVYLGLMLYADTVYSVQSLNGTYRSGNYLDLIWMLGSFLLSAAMLHPSAPQLVARASAATPDATVGRLAVLAIAAVVAPTTMIVQFLRGATPHVILTGLVCNVLFLLVLARMADLVSAQRHAAITDGLTGLRSRRFFEQSLHAEVARAARTGGEIGLLLLDLDHFKTVNDTHGHNGGDRVLVELAHRLTAVIRPGDLAARYGGEEFVVLLPGAGPETATEIAERIRRVVASAPIAVGADRLHHVTVSIGVAGLPAVCADAEDLVLAADRALYAAKNAGRNRVCEAATTV